MDLSALLQLIEEQQSQVPKEVPSILGDILGKLGVSQEAYETGIADPNRTLRGLIESGAAQPPSPQYLNQLAGEDKIRNLFGQLLLGQFPYTKGPTETPIGDVGVGKAITPLISRASKGLWNEPKLKMVRSLVKDIYRETEAASPITKDVLSTTKLLFDDPRATSSLMTSNIFDDIIRLIPQDVLKSLPEDKLIPLLKEAIGHETRHFLIGDPVVYNYVSERFKEIPPIAKKVLEASIPPEQVKSIIAKYPKDKAKAMLNYMYNSELYSYAKEAIEQGGTSYSPIARKFAYLASQYPEFNTTLNQVGGIPTEMARGAKASLEAIRKGGRDKFIESLGFTTGEIREAIKDAQQRVVSTKSRGITKSKVAKAREIPIKEGAKGKIKEYIPTEPSKTKSIRPMYSGPVDPNKEFADDIVKGIKDSRIRDKAWQLIMEHLSTQP